MSLQTAIRVLCDACGAPSESFDGSESNRAAMLFDLRMAGWTQVALGNNPRTRGQLSHLNAIDVCPTCTTSRKAVA